MGILLGTGTGIGSGSVSGSASGGNGGPTNACGGGSVGGGRTKLPEGERLRNQANDIFI